jgi:hypothetical protein
MKAFPIVVLVLLAFAAFFLTFLLAPLAVLLLFYVVYALGRGGAEKTGSPATLPDESEHPWEVARSETLADDEEAAAPATARRARITVVSRTERVIVEPAADAPAADEASADESQAGGITSPANPRTT